MTQLKVKSRYRTQAIDYPEGMIVECTDAEAQALLNDSPGSFESVAEVPASNVGEAAAADDLPVVAAEPVIEEKPEVEPEPEPDLSAMSEETATGLVVPDRKMRGGKVRKSAKKK